MQKNKRYIFRLSLLLSLIFFNINDSFSAEVCPIEETPEYIEKYFENVHRVVENVNNIVSEKYKPPKVSPNTNKSFLKIRVIKNIQWSLNRLFTWEWYEIDLEYTIQWNISEIPKQLKRDVKLLKRESNNLKLAKPEWAQITVTWTQICEWVENCNFKSTDNFKAITVIELLKKSTNKLKNIIKNQANDYNFRDENTKVFLLNPEQLLEEYSKESIKKCSLSESDNWEKWFFLTIIERIKNINLLNENWKNAMADWKEAINLLLWTSDSEKYKQKEREVLAKELQRQWIGWDSAGAIMSNLEAYNNSKSWEFPFIQWKQWFFNSLQLQINEFEEALENKFPWYKNWTAESKEIAAKDIPKEIRKLKTTQEIYIDINSQYNKLKWLTIIEDTNADQLLNRMIDVHISLSEMINTTNKTCAISVSVCNSQKRWEWDCGQCF